MDRALVITDGIFTMRGDHAPMDEIMALAQKHDDDYPENVVVVMDDSHGVGAFGETGRGTEEYTSLTQIDVLVGTLGKAFGVNGGYVTSNAALIRFLRESAPFYIYSNPITPGEAKAAHGLPALLDSATGQGASGPPPGHDQTVRGRPGQTGDGDHSGGTPGGPPHGEGYRQNQRPGGTPLSRTGSWPPGWPIPWSPEATKRSVSRSTPTTPNRTWIGSWRFLGSF